MISEAISKNLPKKYLHGVKIYHSLNHSFYVCYILGR